MREPTWTWTNMCIFTVRLRVAPSLITLLWWNIHEDSGGLRNEADMDSSAASDCQRLEPAPWNGANQVGPNLQHRRGEVTDWFRARSEAAEMEFKLNTFKFVRVGFKQWLRDVRTRDVRDADRDGGSDGTFWENINILQILVETPAAKKGLMDRTAGSHVL